MMVCCRFPGEVDPPYEPSKLFAVKRVRTLKKRPYWERQIVEGELGLGSVIPSHFDSNLWMGF